MGQVYQSRHGRKPRRVGGGAVAPRAYISHAGISSQQVIIGAGRQAIYTALGALAILDGALFLILGLR